MDFDRRIDGAPPAGGTLSGTLATFAAAFGAAARSALREPDTDGQSLAVGVERFVVASTDDLAPTTIGTRLVRRRAPGARRAPRHQPGRPPAGRPDLRRGMSARYQFLPWVREGAANAYTNADTLRPVLQRPDTKPLTGLPVALKVNTTPVDVPLRLYGPGDVLGLDPRAVIRTEPPPGTADFEPNHLAAIEFDAPDFPWLFTPAAAASQGRLRPWLCLVVVERDEASLSAASGRPLPVLNAAAAELPDLAESWVWAHAQVVQADAAEPVQQILTGAPERNLSRLICPRRLEPQTRTARASCRPSRPAAAPGWGSRSPTRTTSRRPGTSASRGSTSRSTSSGSSRRARAATSRRSPPC